MQAGAGLERVTAAARSYVERERRWSAVAERYLPIYARLAGAVDGLSIGYRTLRAEKLPEGGRRLIELVNSRHPLADAKRERKRRPPPGGIILFSGSYRIAVINRPEISGT